MQNFRKVNCVKVHAVKRLRERFGEKRFGEKKIKNMSRSRLNRFILNSIASRLIKCTKKDIITFEVVTEDFLAVVVDGYVKTVYPDDEKRYSQPLKQNIGDLFGDKLDKLKFEHRLIT
mgnify:CR=1 FL=1